MGNYATKQLLSWGFPKWRRNQEWIINFCHLEDSRSKIY